MNHDSWLAKADQLRAGLGHLKAAELDEPLAPSMGDHEERERLYIARWLREEFSDEKPEDRATLMFPFEF